MSEDWSLRGARDRINVDEPEELAAWAAKFGISPEELKEAIEAVGDRVDKVEELLRSADGDRGPED